MAVRDVILVGVLLFVFAIGFFIIHSVMTVTVAKITAVPAINQSQNAVTAFNGIKLTINRLDYVIFGLFIGLSLALIITGWFVAGNPIFMFIYFLVITIGVVFCTVLSNIWGSATGMSIFGSTITYFPLANNLMLRLPIYVAIVGFIGIVVMFAKPALAGE